MTNALQVIREMHKPVPNEHKALVWVYPEGRSELITPQWLCEECQCDGHYCESGGIAWPCRTVLALPEPFHALNYAEATS